MSSIFHELSNEELGQQIEQSRSELRELRFSYAIARTVQDPARFRTLKRNIAKILTVQKERQLGIATMKPKSEKPAKKKK